MSTEDLTMATFDDLRALLHTTEQLTAAGFSTQSLGRAVASGDLIRLRPGFYVDRSTRELGREERHLLMVLAADRALGCPVFTHWSAALVLGLPGWDLPLGTVSLSRAGHAQRSRTTRLTRHDVTPLAEDDVHVVDGLRVTRPERTIVDVARACAPPASVAVADAAFKAEAVNATSVDDALSRAAGRSGVTRARAALARVDARSESVAETRSRLIFADYGLPEPQTQVDIFDTHGNFVARVDFLWPELGLIGECDGFGKYLDGADATEARRRLGVEKDRDAALMALGYRVLHWRWADLDKPRLLVQRLRSVMYPAAA
ncbi:type IV toxin-antitoxin system AbiEi family antitoxin domain-containing protein [Dietzia sp. Marseille-Q0999]|nr:type IV toxin-antitoxin system AbiEi family antitoxin domain-containing protein [Dietzia massiliensis]